MFFFPFQKTMHNKLTNLKKTNESKQKTWNPQDQTLSGREIKRMLATNKRKRQRWERERGKQGILGEIGKN